MEIELSHDRRRNYDDLLNKCSLFRKGYTFLGKHKKRAREVVFLSLEAVSVGVDQLAKSKWGYLLAVILSAFSFLITVYPFAKGRTIAATKPKAERQLLVVEIVFSMIQLTATIYHYTVTVCGVKNNYNAFVFPLAFATIAVVFVFLKDEEDTNSSRDQTQNDSAPRDSHTINVPSTVVPVAGGDSNDENQRVNMSSRQLDDQLQDTEGMEIELSHDRRRNYDDLLNKCSLFRKGYKFLGKHKKRALAVVSFSLEAASFGVDELWKSKWGYLLAVILSAFSFLITLYPFAKGRTIVATKPKAERQLLVIEIVFSVIQLMATIAHYTMTVWGVNKNYNAFVFPLAFAAIAVVFLFLKDDEVTNSSHDQIHNDSAPGDSHTIEVSSTNDSNDENQRENMRSRRLEDQLQNMEVYMLENGTHIHVDLTMCTGYDDLYKNVAEMFNTAEGFLGYGGFSTSINPIASSGLKTSHGIGSAWM